MIRHLPIAILVALVAATAAIAGAASAPAQQYQPALVATAVAHYPHDPDAFTQGLLYFQGDLYESTGLHGHSSLRRVDLDSGRVKHRVNLPHRLFGEGLARVDKRLYQLTWKAGVALVYALPEMRLIGHHDYSGQGWGLAWDGRHLIMSDGSATLRFRDPADFSVERRVRVTHDGEPVTRLNELEYFCGAIWANIRYADVIVRIDPESGVVTGSLDASALRAALPEPSAAGVLNGMAWDPDRRRLVITGKHWPLLFVLRLPGSCRP